MPRVCYISGRKTATGNKRSHSMIASKRTFKINLHNKVVNFGGMGLNMKISSRMYKKLKGFI